MYDLKKEEAKLLITSLESCMINTDRDSISTIMYKCNNACDNMDAFVTNCGINNSISKSLHAYANDCVKVIDLVYGTYAKALKKHLVQDKKIKFFIKDADKKLNDLSVKANLAEIRAKSIHEYRTMKGGIHTFKRVLYVLEGERDENIMRSIAEKINAILEAVIKMVRICSR